jgi:hypothetical protein
MNILLMILKDWKLCTIGILIIALTTLTLMWKYEKHRADDLVVSNALLEQKVATRDGEIKSLKTSIETQNKAVTDLNKKLTGKQEELNILMAYFDEESRKTSEATIKLATKDLKVEDVFITTNCGDKVNRKDGSKEANETWKTIKSKW